MSTNPPEQPEASEPAASEPAASEPEEPRSPQQPQQPAQPSAPQPYAPQPQVGASPQAGAYPQAGASSQANPYPHPPQNPTQYLPPQQPQHPAQYPQQQYPAQYPQQQHPAQYPQQQYPPQPSYPPVPPGWQPPPPPGGKIWLGLLLGAGVPILGIVLGLWLSSTDAYNFSSLLMGLPFWAMVVVAIVLTVLRGTRRTGIGMWIGLATIPIIGLGACVVMLFGLSAVSSY